MSRTGSIFLRALVGLVLIGLLLAGGALLFQAGQAQGYQLGIVAASSAASGEAPGTAPLVPYRPGYWPYYPRPYFGFFPFGGLCGSILVVFLMLFALRLIFWPRRWFYPGKGSGDWSSHPHPWGPPPWMREQPPSNATTGEARAADQPASESSA